MARKGEETFKGAEKEEEESLEEASGERGSFL